MKFVDDDDDDEANQELIVLQKLLWAICIIRNHNLIINRDLYKRTTTTRTTATTSAVAAVATKQNCLTPRRAHICALPPILALSMQNWPDTPCMRDIDSSHSVCCVLSCLLCLMSAESISAHRGCQIKILKQLSKIKVKCYKNIITFRGHHNIYSYQVTLISHQQFYIFSANIHTLIPHRWGMSVPHRRLVAAVGLDGSEDPADSVLGIQRGGAYQVSPNPQIHE